jgi:hypothetical protein
MSPPLLDRLDADGAVAPSAGKDDGEAIAVLFGQGAEEEVNGGTLSARLLEGEGAYLGVRDFEPAVRRDNVDVVACQRDAALDLLDGHRRTGGQNLCQVAAVLRGEVDYDHGRLIMLSVINL